MKNKLAALFLGACIASTYLTPIWAVKITSIDTITIKLNNETVEFDQQPIIENGRTLVPFRAILEAMGVSVNWDAKTKTITCNKDNNNVSLTIGMEYIEVNGKKLLLDVPAKIENGRTLVPLRAVSEGLGADVYWNEKTRTVEIYSYSSENNNNLSSGSSLNLPSESDLSQNETNTNTEEETPEGIIIKSTVNIYTSDEYSQCETAFITVCSNLEKLNDKSVEEIKSTRYSYIKESFTLNFKFSKFLNSPENTPNETAALEFKEYCDKFLEKLKTFKEDYEKVANENGISIDYETSGDSSNLETSIADKELDNKMIKFVNTINSNLYMLDEHGLNEFMEIYKEAFYYDADIRKNPKEVIQRKRKEINAKYKEFIKKFEEFTKKYNIPTNF